mmetsp:Transcript_7875/g.13167  ORF Transcript_7875/g.13167 Transcript_7875/m.13167 type:complete len:100 (-) Transcript_7875:4-303(-)
MVVKSTSRRESRQGGAKKMGQGDRCATAASNNQSASVSTNEASSSPRAWASARDPMADPTEMASGAQQTKGPSLAEVRAVVTVALLFIDDDDDGGDGDD